MDYDDDLERYDEEEWRLHSVLADHKDYWQDIFEDYWGIATKEPPDYLTKEHWEDARRFDDTAKRIIKAGLSLDIRQMAANADLSAASPQMVAFVRDLLSTVGESILVRDRFSFELAEDALGRLKDAPERLRNLLSLVLSGSIDDRTSAFLGRVGKLYVFGYEPEALVMCRAALDAALQECFPDERMNDILKGRRPRGYTLEDRIYGARATGIFTSQQKRSADILRRSGNQAVHVAPAFLVDGVSDALEAIRILTDLLVALFHRQAEDNHT